MLIKFERIVLYAGANTQQVSGFKSPKICEQIL